MTSGVTLRDVADDDLPVFFEFQRDPDANRMAAFPPRDREAFAAHWAKIRADATVTIKTVLLDGQVAGSVVSFEKFGQRLVGYWLGKPYWGRGVATAALAQFLGHDTARPLHARVAKHNVASIRVLEKCGFTVCGADTFSDATGQECEELILVLGADQRGEAR